MNSNGRGSGLLLIIILLVALLIAFLVVKQMGSFGIGKTDSLQEPQQDPVQQAQNAVDAINNRTAQGTAVQ